MEQTRRANKEKNQLKVRRGRKQVRRQTAEITFSQFGWGEIQKQEIYNYKARKKSSAPLLNGQERSFHLKVSIRKKIIADCHTK